MAISVSNIPEIAEEGRPTASNGPSQGQGGGIPILQILNMFKMLGLFGGGSSPTPPPKTAPYAKLFEPEGGIVGTPGATGGVLPSTPVSSSTGIGMTTPTATSSMGATGTGAGTASKILSGLQTAGALAGGMADRRSGDRQADILATLSADRNLTDQYGIQQNAVSQQLVQLRNLLEQAQQHRADQEEKAKMDRAKLDLEQRQFQTTAPGVRFNTGIRADAMANYRPQAPPSHPRATMTDFSGLLPQISDTGRSLAQTTARQMLDKQMSGDVFDPIAMPEAAPLPDTTSSILDKPGNSPLAEPSKVDTILNILSLLGAGAGAVGSVSGGQGRTALGESPTVAGQLSRSPMVRR